MLGLWHLGIGDGGVPARAGRARRSSASIPTPATVAGLAARHGRRSPSRASRELVDAGLAAGRLRFTTDVAEAVSRRRRRLGHVRHAGRRRRSRRRRVRRRRRSTRRFPHLRDGARRARLVAGAGRHDRARSKQRWRGGRGGRRRVVRVLAGEPAARQGDRGLHAARPRRRRRARRRGRERVLAALFAPITERHRVDVGRVGRDDQARASTRFWRRR